MKSGMEISPPSPEISFDIIQTALRLGSIRFSYANLYLILTLILLFTLIAAAIFFFKHLNSYRKKNARLIKEILEAEKEVRSGFSLLHQDINQELEAINKIRKFRQLSVEEERREEKLLADLDFVENHILKEIGDIKPAN